MRSRSRTRNLVEYAVALIALKCLQIPPLPVAQCLARCYARLLDLAIPRLRRTALQNLAFALPDADARQVVNGVFRSIARLLVSFARFPSIRRDTVGKWIRHEGFEHVQCALAAGKGVLFATAHLGNWELSAYAHALLASPMSVVVRPLDNPYIDRLVEHRRSLSGNRPIFKKDYARAILKALAANEAVGILIDQNASLDNGVFVDFFGFAIWSEKERRYVLRFYPPVPMTGDAARDTQALQSQLESIIREYPDQWLWIHRRWKTRPPGEPSVYG